MLLLTIVRTSPWSLQTGTASGNVRSQTPDTRTPDEAGGPGNYRSPETSRRSCGYGIKSPVHGDERSGEVYCYDDDELYAWMHAI